eukprot:CAMPEP_0168203288 /NCGR_PEP_ID=MMETSP0139_2-20121125/24765_1 /TAXON_ID=44445 /ORGANISM="Pseudo-nitzschia australis, Strain 10249 10 AB" /LENGTH=645 /DNA_ID=CAMNT_0008129111 /DNA_START=319 /DNA_END=2256 /DNA_ORIENTATION=-
MAPTPLRRVKNESSETARLERGAGKKQRRRQRGILITASSTAAVVVACCLAFCLASCCLTISGVRAFSTTRTSTSGSGTFTTPTTLTSLSSWSQSQSRYQSRFPSFSTQSNVRSISNALGRTRQITTTTSSFNRHSYDAHAGVSRRTRTTRLTTTTSGNSNDSGETNNNNNVFATAAAKFKARPGTYLMIPVIAGFVGWLTNYLAVQMIFYPVQFKGIPIWRKAEVPLGLLGWQGIVPCKTVTMSKVLVEMVQTQLLTVPEAFARLNPRIVAKHLAGAVPQLGEAIIQDVGAATAVAATTAATPFPLALWRSVFCTGQRWYSGVLNFCNVQILKGVTKDLIRNSERIFSLENCVVDQMLLDRAKLGQLFQKVGKVELEFLTNSGLWFGFLLGLIQMAVALVWENPWALSIGGTIVGLATNWLALKWIFEPVYPTKIGPFVVQGMFLKRQKEVAAEFSKFFADKIVTSEQIWNSILTDPTTTPALSRVLGKHVKRLLSIASLGGIFSKGLASPETVGKVTGSAIANLPRHLSSGLHKYVDGALGLETTLRTQMEAMSPAKFERVLHPIFEEDELTLIIAGGILGFIAGLIQQGLETGAIKVPPLPAPIQKLLARAKNAVGFKKKAGGDNGNDESGDADNGDGVSGE